MNTMTTMDTTPERRPSTSNSRAIRRFVSVVAEPDSYRNLTYLLLGLPLGTIWFTALVTGVSVGVSLIVVALVGIPVLVGVGFLTRVFANVERSVASALLHQQLPHAPVAVPGPGNPLVRLRAMIHDRRRRRELGYLMLRFPVGITTFTAAVTAITVPAAVASAPFVARWGGDEPFGDWAQSNRMEDMASSPWAWSLLAVAPMVFVIAVQLSNALARACRRWNAAWLV